MKSDEASGSSSAPVSNNGNSNAYATGPAAIASDSMVPLARMAVESSVPHHEPEVPISEEIAAAVSYRSLPASGTSFGSESKSSTWVLTASGMAAVPPTTTTVEMPWSSMNLAVPRSRPVELVSSTGACL